MLGVLERMPGRNRRSGHGRHRTATGVVAALSLTGTALLGPALLGPALLSPAAGSEGGSGDGGKVTFTVGLLNEVDSFNPFNGVEAASFEMWALSYDMLVGYAMEDLSPAPALAASWETSEDGLTWTFTLRDGATWNDGEPLTADDVVHTYNRVLDGGREADSWSSYLNSVEEVSAPDDLTVVLQLGKPSATLPLLPIPILPEHVWKDVSEKEVETYDAEPNDGPVVGSGPFTLVEGTAGGSTYRFEANPDYWGGAPHVDEVVYRVFKAEDPAVQALIKGEVDFLTDVSPLQRQALEGREGITTTDGVSPYFEEFAFNTGAIDTGTGEPIGDGNPALEDPAFRHALGYAIDTERLIENAYQGAAKPGQTIIPDFYEDFHWSPPEDEAFRFDLEEAGRLLDEAGYEEGPDGLRTMPDGSPIGTLRLYGRPEEKRSITSMDFLKEWLADLGIESEVTAMESGRLTNVILDGDYDVFHWGWYVEADPDGILSYMTCEQRGSWSDSWWCNEEYDRLYEAQAVELDDESRAEMVHQMQQIMWQESPYLVIGYTTTGQAFRSDRFACFQPQPDPGGVLLIQYGGRNYTLLRPADEAGDCDGVESAIGLVSAETGGGGGGEDADGGSTTAVVLAGGGLLALMAAGGVWAFRRRATAGQRE